MKNKKGFKKNVNISNIKTKKINKKFNNNFILNKNIYIKFKLKKK